MAFFSFSSERSGFRDVPIKMTLPRLRFLCFSLVRQIGQTIASSSKVEVRGVR